MAARLPDELQGRWNHNSHYYPLALAAARPGDRALDVGCGDGMLLRLLAGCCAEVVGLDESPMMVELARGQCADLPAVSVRRGDLLHSDFDDASFDLVTSYAAIHHMPFAPALRRMADLLRPGGRLVVLGLAKNRTLRDMAVDPVSFVAHRLLAPRYGYYEQPAPVADPTMGWGEVRRATAAILPAARWRRRLLWRYSITWARPS